MKTIGFIGGGRITRIILQAWRNKNLATEGVFVYDPNPAVLQKLSSDFRDIQVSSDSPNAAAACELVFLAVHPPAMMEVLAAVKPFIQSQAAVVSLAPKITLAKMESVLDHCHNLARMNPSASTFINQGLNPICFSSGFEPSIKEKLKLLFDAMGSLPEVEEPKIEAYAMMSAMGHTYFWFQIQKLRELAVSFGMEPAEADRVLKSMMEGTVNTLLESGLDYEQVIDLVPVKPIGASEPAIKGYYDEYLPALYLKIKP